jgi:hypothetical protein
MSSVVPRERLARIGWYETRDPVWSANATALGTTTVEVGALATKVAAARTAYDAQQLARAQAKAATTAYYNAVTAMSEAGVDVIQKIKAKAAVDGDSVYVLALIPPPAAPQPIGPPGMPTDFTAALDPSGTLNLAWRCVNPAGAGGTIYQVARQIGSAGGGGGEMQIIGATGQRKFADPTVPAGTAQVTYRIQALRSTVAGTANEFTVKFGVSGGAMTARVVGAAKLAA